MPDWAGLAAYLPTLQLMAYYRSVHKGLTRTARAT